ncbi:MAG: group III truncated hemoglobin, partial [Bacteroidota bacterium]
YKGSPFNKHAPLPIDAKHFEQWLQLFKQTMDDLFKGENAEHLKYRAEIMGFTFNSKLEHLKNNKSQ